MVDHRHARLLHFLGRSLLTWAFVLAGCGTQSSAGGSGDAGASSDDSAGDASTAFTFTSSAFIDKGTLPAASTCNGAGTSPPLAWSGTPAGTAELVLLMTTVAVDGLKWNWVLYHIPASVTSLAQAGTSIGSAGLTSDGPLLQYSPPCSSGPGSKDYVFTLYALSAELAFGVAPDRVDGALVTAAIADRTIASKTLTVSYARP